MDLIQNLINDLETIRVEVDTTRLFAILFILFITIGLGIVFKKIILPPIVSVFDKNNDNLMEIITEELKDIPYKGVISLGLYLSLLSTDAEFKIPFLFGIIEFILVIIILYYFVQVLNVAVKRYAYRKALNTSDKSMSSAYLYGAGIFRMVAWFFAIIIVFGNLGYDVSALIAGLGISGVAVAFALRDLIKDMIGSFLIIFDKPIRVGDYINGTDYNGTVKKIGIKSTSLVSDSGNEVIVPNTIIVDKVLTNLKSHRRFSEQIKIFISADVLKKKDFNPRNIISSYLDIYLENQTIEKYKLRLNSRTTEGLEYFVNINIHIEDQNQLEELLEEIGLGLYTGLYGKSKKGEVRVERGE